MKSRRLRWGEHIVARLLTGNLTGKRPLGRPKRRWEDNIRMNLKETAVNMTNWIFLASG